MNANMRRERMVTGILRKCWPKKRNLVEIPRRPFCRTSIQLDVTPKTEIASPFALVNFWLCLTKGSYNCCA